MGFTSHQFISFFSFGSEFKCSISATLWETTSLDSWSIEIKKHENNGKNIYFNLFLEMFLLLKTLMDLLSAEWLLSVFFFFYCFRFYSMLGLRAAKEAFTSFTIWQVT